MGNIFISSAPGGCGNRRGNPNKSTPKRFARREQRLNKPLCPSAGFYTPCYSVRILLKTAPPAFRQRRPNGPVQCTDSRRPLRCKLANQCTACYNVIFWLSENVISERICCQLRNLRRQNLLTFYQIEKEKGAVADAGK